jgi:hypothetical protein
VQIVLPRNKHEFPTNVYGSPSSRTVFLFSHWLSRFGESGWRIPEAVSSVLPAVGVSNQMASSQHDTELEKMKRIAPAND